MEFQQEVGFKMPTFMRFSMPGPEQGLKAMLEDVDDLLFMLDENDQIINCKARIQSTSIPCPLYVRLSIQEILPATVRRKYNQALERFHHTKRFTLFESMLVMPPSEVNWYEFRLIPTLERQTVLFIWNVNSYRGLSRTVSNVPTYIEKLIEGWSRSLYLRDFETEDHTRRVTEMTVRLARRLGLPEEDMVNIRRGAQVHDIGKITIPDAILLKTQGLTTEEWDVMRRHTLVAVELLENIPQIEAALTIPRSHHEKWNGSGYPNGLAGTDIPLLARIFAFADVYDALTSDRPYRRLWSSTDALNYIRSEAGKHFDPSLTPEFIRMMLE